MIYYIEIRPLFLSHYLPVFINILRNIVHMPVKQKEIDLDPTGQEITKTIPDFPLS